MGLAAARGVVRAGCRRVALFARGTSGVEEALESLRGLGGEPLFINGDLTREASIEGLIPGVLREFGALDVVVMSYGNPGCEPCSLEDSGWRDWIEASSMYLASTGVIARDLVRYNSVKATLIVFSSFTVSEPHKPLFISDTVRHGLRALVRALSRMHPDKLRPILIELGSFMTPGAIKTISKLAESEGVSFNDYWKSKVEGLSPLRRAGSLDELEELISIILKTPEYMTGSIIRFDGASTPCVY